MLAARAAARISLSQAGRRCRCLGKQQHQHQQQQQQQQQAQTQAPQPTAVNGQASRVPLRRLPLRRSRCAESNETHNEAERAAARSAKVL